MIVNVWHTVLLFRRIQFSPIRQHVNADRLSRLQLQTEFILGNPSDILHFTDWVFPVASFRNTSAGQSLTLPAAGLATNVVPQELLMYWCRRAELTIEVIVYFVGDESAWMIPTKFQSKVLAELHQGHPGIVRIKTLVRSHVWWPDLDKAIESCVKSCSACRANNGLFQVTSEPMVLALFTLKWVHVDYVWPIMGKILLIITDAHSNWPEGVSPLVRRPFLY